jgi:UDP-N-acetylmuramate dehydrogenase
MDWKEELKRKFRARCKFDEPLSAHTTYKIGGPAEVFLLPKKQAEWIELVKFARLRKIPLTVLGLGSNVLAADGGVAGLVCCTTSRKDIEICGCTVRASAGAPLDGVARAAIAAGLAGMEKLSGIPGTVGGAVRMNAGAFGQETFDCLTKFCALDSAGHPVSIRKNGVDYGYRRVNGLEGLIILSAEWELERGDTKLLQKTRRETLKTRAEKQPLDFPSAGSVFKRPPGAFASKLIDEAGLKGLKTGGAQVSEKHAGFIINTGDATAQDVAKLIATVKSRVKAKTGVELELEQVLLGDFTA